LIALQFPQIGNLRIDSGVETGSEVTPFYDPMIAKLIAHGQTRDEALDRLAKALEQTVVIGPRSNAGFLAALCRAPAFRAGDFDTAFIERNLAELGVRPTGVDRAAAALGLQKLLMDETERRALTQDQEPDAVPSPWDATDAYQFSGTRNLAVPILADSEILLAQVSYDGTGAAVRIGGERPATDAVAVASGNAVYVLRHGRQTKVTLRNLGLDETGDHGKSGLVRAPMHGKVLALLVEQGARVVRGQRVAVIEAMKMEHTLVAPLDGTVAEITVAPHEQVPEGAKIMLIEPRE